ncbi:hypothetical protein HELRODRAFT_178979 [Helobdella robusta]|uniref:C-type lectin domain-containing protein n=1 Tax=Helobdella robusta TaxID=6412 RepID=T1FE01_HELRO|nr:hypothetical protein HELRODRAFT_178979 [Helobdella robusta]ESN95796.1 hypothetical protein HELRODRAFT_178979 [Helobdella robusta]
MSRLVVAILLLIPELDAELDFCVFNWNTTKSWPIKNWTKSNEFCMNFVGNSFLLNEYVNVQFEQIFEIFRYSNAAVDEMIWTGLRLIGGSLVWESISPTSMLTRAIPRKGFDIEPGEYEYTDDTGLCGALQRSTRVLKLISCSSQINFTCFQIYPKLSTYPPLTNSSHQFNPNFRVKHRFPSSLDGRYERDVYRQSYKKCDKGWVTGRNPNLCFKAMDNVVSCDIANEECSRYESGSLAVYDDLDLEELSNTIS